MSTKLVTQMRRLMIPVAAVAIAMTTAGVGHTDPTPVVDPSQEQFSSPDAIKSVATTGAATAIWATLEHGEHVECLDCLSYIEPLLYDQDYRVREISAWWIRRRVFGYAAIAMRVRATLNPATMDPNPIRRAAAANALGEFLDSGATPILVAAASDSDAGVRAAVMAAVQRMNDMAGAPAISSGLKDSDVGVRRAALEASMRLTGFSDVASVAGLLGDGDAVVRAKACDALGIFQATGSLSGLLAIARADSDEGVRIAAVNAIGDLDQASARDVLTTISTSDTSSRVRDAANVALLKIAGAT